MDAAIVVTSIQPPTPGIEAIAQFAQSAGVFVYVIGDRKTGASWQCEGIDFFSLADQYALNFHISKVLPENCYARKMLGYMIAVDAGARWIRETDDDNLPYSSFFESVPRQLEVRVVGSSRRWLNVYSAFTDRLIWPRGLPLGEVHHRISNISSTEIVDVEELVIFQALANGDPDVDAVFRLTAGDTSAVSFNDEMPLLISRDQWTPFNSQATTWPAALLPLMYLPVTCSFRMTDIWRSFITQRLMPGLNARLVVTPPTVYQERNHHDLMRDFTDEIEGYIGYDRFVDLLLETEIMGGVDNVLTDIRTIYVALVNAGFFSQDELVVLDAWLLDMADRGFVKAH